MEKSVIFELTKLQQVIWYSNYGGFRLCDKNGKDIEEYPELKDVIKAYLKKHSPKEGSILVRRSVCLDPQRGWYRADRGSRFAHQIYLLTLDQLPYLKDHASKDSTTVEWYLISSGRANVVSRESLLQPWFEATPSEVKKKWLEKMLFEEVVKNPTRFL